MLKSLFICTTFVFLAFSKVQCGSFSQSLFGSEGESSVTNPEIRSLSYSLQYITFAGISSYFVKQLHDDGFFGPFGFKPDYLESLSPLAYSKYPIKIEKTLKDAKNDIHKKNEILILRDQILQSPTNDSQLLQESKSSFDRFLLEEENRFELISRYLK